ncbi:MAG: hypothetical protein EOO06_07595 [Chitinophagaceae bacterium]|nr:MAG: hypothetical protein EOO06_07595 [Chitinophagaceae bacterium]
MSYTLTQLTTLAKTAFSNSFNHGQVEIFATKYEQENCLVFRVKQSNLPQYLGERPMFGKTIRLLLYLQTNNQLVQWLQVHDFPYVMVTEATNPQLVTKLNSTVLLTSFVKEVYDDTSTLRNVNNSVAEQSIRTLIAQNAHL